MVDARARAGARTRLEHSARPRTTADVEGFDATNPRDSAPAALIEARELSAREQMIAVERAKLLREDVVACYRAEGVNHLERCRGAVARYLESIKNVGTQRLNFGEHDR